MNPDIKDMNTEKKTPEKMLDGSKVSDLVHKAAAAAGHVLEQAGEKVEQAGEKVGEAALDVGLRVEEAGQRIKAVGKKLTNS